MKAILIANGSVSDYEQLKSYICVDDVVICADGGYDHAQKAGIKPDIVLGDMDSIGSHAKDVAELIYPARKDFTDSELVVDYAIGKGYRELVLFGFIGTRMDHTLTNILLISKYPEAEIVIMDAHNEIRLARQENIISGKKGDLVSVIPIHGDLIGVTTKRLEYPLRKETLHFGEGRGVSNVMTEDTCEITIDSGVGLIIKSVD